MGLLWKLKEKLNLTGAQEKPQDCPVKIYKALATESTVAWTSSSDQWRSPGSQFSDMSIGTPGGHVRAQAARPTLEFLDSSAMVEPDYLHFNKFPSDTASGGPRTTFREPLSR